MYIIKYKGLKRKLLKREQLEVKIRNKHKILLQNRIECILSLLLLIIFD